MGCLFFSVWKTLKDIPTIDIIHGFAWCQKDIIYHLYGTFIFVSFNTVHISNIIEKS